MTEHVQNERTVLIVDRRGLIASAAAAGLTLAFGREEIEARHKSRRKAGTIHAEGMTWKNTPLWNINGYLVDVGLAWDDALLTGRIAAILSIPTGMSATLVQDVTPTDWEVRPCTSGAIYVDAKFPGGPGTVGVDITPPTNPYGWDYGSKLGRYGIYIHATTT